MEIHGLQKMTLLDYPGKVAATLFTGSCNFRCPYCHNSELVVCPDSVPLISNDEIFHFLEKRQNLLDGICITGGEPTLQKDLLDFIRKIKSLGYLIKLDTNGYRPDVLQTLLQNHLLDYIAMDIKQAPSHYHQICGISDFDFSKIQTSVDAIRNSHIPYEFRTTMVSEYHTVDDVRELGQFLSGSRAYYLQNYRDTDTVMSPGLHGFTLETLQHFQHILEQTIPVVEIRGIDH